MKIFCISDTEADPESSKQWLAICKKDLESSDKIFHLGDGIKNIKKLLSKYKVIYIKGNHDTSDDCRLKEYEIRVNNVNFFLFHGRRKKRVAEKINIYSNYLRKFFNKRPNLESYYSQLFKEYKGRHDVVLYGHMHSPRIDIQGSTIFFCPGSFSLKDAIKEPTFGIIEISKRIKNQMTFTVLSINKDLLKKVLSRTINL